MIKINNLYVNHIESIRITRSDLSTDQYGNKNFCVFVNNEWTGLSSWDRMGAESLVRKIINREITDESR